MYVDWLISMCLQYHVIDLLVFDWLLDFRERLAMILLVFGTVVTLLSTERAKKNKENVKNNEFRLKDLVFLHKNGGGGTESSQVTSAIFVF